MKYAVKKISEQATKTSVINIDKTYQPKDWYLGSISTLRAYAYTKFLILINIFKKQKKRGKIFGLKFTKENL